jgi:hypothetical protein
MCGRRSGRSRSPSARTTRDEILALKIFVAVTAPLCWSTDLLQSDEELSQFNFRPDSERTKAPNAFWADEGRRYLHLARFRKDVLQVLCTEAAVERSFAVEGELWNKKRNRLSEGNVDDAIFISMNYRRLRLKLKEDLPTRTARKIEIDRDEWQRLVESLKEESPRTPRAKRNIANPNLIVRGSSIEVKFTFKEGRQSVDKWCPGIVVEVIANKKLEFKVCWDGFEGAAKISEFRPLTSDTEWRFAGK